jgi:hypothetical protein
MTVTRKTHTTPAAKAAKTDSTAAAGRLVQLSSVKNADSGLKVKTDAATGSITLSGTAKGVQTRDPLAPNDTFGSDHTKTEEFGGTIGFDFDHDKMPKFDTSAGYTEKNKWYFAHSVSIGTKAGQTAEQVAEALAAKVKGAGYKVSVTTHADGSATQQVHKK